MFQNHLFLKTRLDLELYIFLSNKVILDINRIESSILLLFQNRFADPGRVMAYFGEQ